MDIVVAHMVGDYLLQNTWMAMNKQKNIFICLLHAFLYSLAFNIICGWGDWRFWVILITHLIIDHWRIGAIWRKFFSGDTDLPWVITADNTIHLLIAWILIKL